MTALFNTNNPDLYIHTSGPEHKERTNKRLIQMAELGMEQLCIAQFGIRDIVSGLYIEMVWSYTDEEFEDYMDWVKERKEFYSK